MPPNNIELSDEELTLIFRLCESATVNGYETAKTLVSLMDKITSIAEENKVHKDQTIFPFKE
jgi:hypothetical protein|tara:strand:+ start:1337 stop:1522 length:186 start_codon:yes stop_codon:yes gene_type:complete